MISESEFIAAADGTLERIGSALDAALQNSDVDLDWSCKDGILEVDCEGGGKVILNRHVPNRELWLAARSGGFHFKPVDGAWRDTRSGEGLEATLTRVLQEQCGLVVPLSQLAAP
ncbi:MAG TPA: iron donor protein CyaY [Casimicrobiaceae bacterium]|nr:iron donor protein CyaY [Casimicrobiaceae bacterium]